jgi:shikimate O-hydroxycinnamoyltransferase
MLSIWPVCSGVMHPLQRGDCQVDAPSGSPCSGALLTTQTMLSIDFSILESSKFSNRSIPPCVCYSKYEVGVGEPLVHAHVTRLTGGIAVGLAVHHWLGDGAAAFNFFTAWADLTRAGKLVSADKPCFDRSLLSPSADISPGAHMELKIQRPTAPSIDAPLDAVRSAPQQPAIGTEYFHFSPEALLRLKNAATASLPGSALEHDGWISTNDALSALFWRAFTRARGLDSSPNLQVMCSFACDCRSRLQPALPPGFFGNVVFIAGAERSAGDLLKSSLGEAALEIRRATQRHTADAYIRSTLSYVETAEDKSWVKWACEYFMGKDIFLTNWSKFGLLDIDFGIGKPHVVRQPNTYLDGICIILPASDGGLDVLTGLLVPHWEKLLTDPEFLQFALPLT